MKVLLVFPMRPKKLQSWIIPPLGLGYLAQALKDAGHDVELMDCVRDKIDFVKFKELMREMDFDLVCFTSYNQDVKAVTKMCSILKHDLNKRAKIVIGGPYVASCPDTAMNLIKDADYGFMGEAEEGIVILAEHLSGDEKKLNEIPNILFRKNGGIIKGPRKFMDPNKVPIPAWDILYAKHYPNTPPTFVHKNSNFAPIIITRGCPYNCTYCAAHKVHGKNIRKRNLDNVIAEIDLLYNKYGKREFHIVDDNFTMDKDYVIEFCKRIVNKGYDIYFTNPNGVRLNTLDFEMLQWMKKAGWYLLCVGIESGSDRILSDMRKGLTVDMVREKVELTRKAGIDVHGFFILGYPTETLKDIKKTIKFSLELDLIGATFSCFLPFYGTEVYNELVANKEIQPLDLREATFAQASYVPKGMTRKQLKHILRNAILRFYLRPRIIIKQLSYIRSPEHFRYLIRRGFDYLF